MTCKYCDRKVPLAWLDEHGTLPSVSGLPAASLSHHVDDHWWPCERAAPADTVTVQQPNGPAELAAYKRGLKESDLEWLAMWKRERRRAERLRRAAIQARCRARALPADTVTVKRATLKALRDGLEVVREFTQGGGQHSNVCNGGEEGPCDCDYVDPRDVVDALLERLAGLED